MDYVYGPGRNHLFVPGPVNIPEPVIRAMNRNNEDYRSPAIPALTKTLLEDVKKIFKTTTGTPFMIPTTGIMSNKDYNNYVIFCELLLVFENHRWWWYRGKIQSFYGSLSHLSEVRTLRIVDETDRVGKSPLSVPPVIPINFDCGMTISLIPLGYIYQMHR